MRALTVVVGMIGVVAFFLAMGLLEIRAEAVDMGAIISLDNRLEGVTPPQAPVLQRAAIACLAAVAVFLFHRLAAADNPTGASTALAGSVALLIASVWIMFSTDHPFSGIDTGSSPAEHPLVATARAAAHSSATHVTAVLLGLIGTVRLRGARSKVQRDTRK